MTPEYAYAVVAHGGSGKYEFTNFLGLAFSWEEVQTLVEEDRGGPCPGKQHDVTRRKIGLKSSKHMTIWRHESWLEVDMRKWRT